MPSVSKVFSSLLPENKSDKIAALLKEYGTVAMVGDGINDASTRIEYGGDCNGSRGKRYGNEVADIALMNDKLSHAVSDSSQ
jgi:Cd2+/Zn2+-exporting ATPase